MTKEIKYVKVGQTKKVHGVEGELKVRIFEERIEDFLNAEFLFLEIDGGKVPFFVENVRMTDEPLVLFEDISSSEDALPYTAKDVYIQEKDLIPDEEKLISPKASGLKFRIYIGWKIHDRKDTEVGEIVDIVEYPQQEMALVAYRNREILIPMNKALIMKIDNERQAVLMDLPEGLLDL